MSGADVKGGRGAIWRGGWRQVGDVVAITVEGEEGVRSRKVEVAEDLRMVE